MKLKLTNRRRLQEPTLETSMVEVLDVLEERHQIVEESWNKVIENLPTGCPEDLTQTKILMDTEIARYRRYLMLLRDKMLLQERRLLTGI